MAEASCEMIRGYENRGRSALRHAHRNAHHREWLAQREHVKAAEAAIEDRDETDELTQLRYGLWQASSERAHLRVAKRLLDFRAVHAP